MVPKASPKPGTESADPLSGILELAQEAQTDASDPRRQLSPSIDTDALISGMVSERVRERPRIGDVTGSDVYQGSGITSLFNALTEETPEFKLRRELKTSPPGLLDYETSLESRLASYQDELTQGLPGLGGYTSDDSYGVRSEDGKKAGGKNVQGDSEVQAQSLSEIVVDRDRKDLSGILSKITSDGASDSAFDRYTSLDFSDLIEDSKRMARANALMQLGAGIASGDTAKALSAAGTAATKGMQDARTLDMRKRLADYQAGREDLRRGEEAERFERQLASQESQFDRTLTQAGLKLKADIEKGIRVNKGQLLGYIGDVLKESGRDLIPPVGQTRQDMLIELQDQLLRQFGPFLDVDVSELVASGDGDGGGGGGQPDFSGFSIRN